MIYFRNLYLICCCLFFCCNDKIMQTTMDCNDIYNGLQLPEFNLQDLNPNSSSYNYNINPESFPGMIRLFYFSSNEN